MIPSALYTDVFKILKTEQSISSTGKITHKVNTVSTENRGRFSDAGDGRTRNLMGSYKNSLKYLYCNVNDDIQFGRIIEDSECEQYDIIGIDIKKYFGTAHHMEVKLDRRLTKIS